MKGTKRFSVIDNFTGDVVYESDYFLECLAFQERNDDTFRLTSIVDNEM